jgi:hypothetical protein
MYATYFNEIFQSSKTVIIPGLGSFTKLNETSINFNPYLKFNDGYLIGFIAKKQGITIDEAGKNISESVAKIQDALTQKGEAMVLGLGVLKKGADGKINFTTGGAVENKASVEEVKKEIPPVAKEIQKPIVTEVKEKIVEVAKPLEVKKPEIPAVKIEAKGHDVNVNAPKLTDVSTAKKDPKVEKSAKEEEAKKLKLAKEEEAKKAKLNKDEAANKAKIEKEAAAKKAKLAKDEAARIAKEKKDAAKLAKLQARGDKKKRKFPVWLMIVLALVIGGGTFTAIKWEMVQGWLGMKKTNTEEPKKEIAKVDEVKDVPVAAEDTTIVAEEPVVEEVKTEPVKAKKEKITPVKIENTQPVTNGNFHVITGNFTNSSLAAKMVEKLNAEGHQASNLGVRGGFNMISAGDFSNLEEAKSKLDAIKATYPKAYIYNGQ